MIATGIYFNLARSCEAKGKGQKAIGNWQKAKGNLQFTANYLRFTIHRHSRESGNTIHDSRPACRQAGSRLKLTLNLNIFSFPNLDL